MKKKCLICNSYDIKEYKHLFICANCGFYENKYKRFKEDIQYYYDNFFNQQGIVDRSKTNIYYKIKKQLVKKFNIQKIKVLEVGFGSGYFLKQLEQLGYEVYGVELSTKFVEIAKTLLVENKSNLYLGDIENVEFPYKFFDVIVLIDVLYEMQDLNSVFRKIREILKDDGLLIIRVKNATVHILLDKFSKFLSLFIKSPFVYHNFGFTFKSLNMILIKHGFKILKNKAYLYLTSGDPYQQSKLSKEFILTLKHLYFILSELIYLLSSFIISSSFMVYAVKR